MENLSIRQITSDDLQWICDFLTEHWVSTEVVTRGEVHHADELPGFVAEQDNNPIGLVTYQFTNNQCEIVTLNSLVEGIGIGTELIKRVIQEAIKNGCERVWLITTNDNTNALRFYQTRGFHLAALYKNAIEKSRELKPEIPSWGIDSIPIRDEIELEMILK